MRVFSSAAHARPTSAADKEGVIARRIVVLIVVATLGLVVGAVAVGALRAPERTTVEPIEIERADREDHGRAQPDKPRKPRRPKQPEVVKQNPESREEPSGAEPAPAPPAPAGDDDGDDAGESESEDDDGGDD